MPPKFFGSEIISNDPVMGDAKLITITAPHEIAREAKGGHFVHILCRESGLSDPLLRRPFSVMSADPDAGTLTILVRPYGRGSGWLDARKTGTRLDVLGLLGNTFSVNPGSRNLLMVAGGVGAAPLVLLAREAIASGLNVTYLMGGANADALLPSTVLPDAVEYVVATDDGSKGHKGFVTELVPDYTRWADQVFSCGPEPMFRALRNAINPHRIGGKPEVQVSMERTMACGVGACLGCVVETKRGMSTSCVEGPVYAMDDILW